ncbi:NAD(P)/FAD-dependent oxidoreductase [Primorskyibacter sp. S87]|uniref:NAD(P)/FAD-dependent oxidoreductase n=1 Tax=Primorskyibacter sp. S87 TaxID=3415126 RepID=UPI003C7A0F92
MPETEAVSLWDMSSAEPDSQVGLSGDTTCDLVIVGAGYTGLSTALHASELGLECHVLEAERIGHGGSGRNVGLVNAGLWLPPQEVLDHLGTETGSRLIELLGAMPEEVFRLIDRHEIRCEAVQNGTIHVAHSPAGYDGLARRAEQWQVLGAPVDLLGADETAKLTGTARFHGGLLDRRAGTIDPMGYARGLARAALAAGATISTGVRATGLTRLGDLWEVATSSGTVTAKHVVLATNAYTDDLWPGLRQSYTPIEYFQLSTEPLGQRAAHVLPERQGIWDTAPVMFSMRRDLSGRIVVGSMGSVFGGTAGLSRRWAARILGKLYPELGDLKFEHAWHGRIAMTPDHIFRIHRLAKGVYSPIGYNGRGIVTGTLFGKALADLIAGGREQDLPLPFSALEHVGQRSLRAGLFKAAFAATQLYRSF